MFLFGFSIDFPLGIEGVSIDISKIFIDQVSLWSSGKGCSLSCGMAGFKSPSLIFLWVKGGLSLEFPLGIEGVSIDISKIFHDQRNLWSSGKDSSLSSGMAGFKSPRFTFLWIRVRGFQ